MKKMSLFVAAAIAAAACSPLYNQTKSYDEAHFTALEQVMAHPTTPRKVKYVFTEASDLNIIGKAFKTADPYARIDTSVYKGFTALENRQCRASAGLAVMFSTNATTISVESGWGQPYQSWRTTGIGYRGYDLYIRNAEGEWIWAASGATNLNEKDGTNAVLISGMDGSTHECLMYLPMYSELKSCRIGVNEGAEIKAAENPFRHKIVFHGSSYTQGISVSRSGMTYPLQFERHTGLYVIPLGFGGNCKMQDYFCDVICDIDADAYVFDAFSNPDHRMIEQRLQPFIDRLIAAHPGKPLIFQQTIYREIRNFSVNENASEQAKQDMASSIFDKLLKDPKYKDVYFIQTDACEPDCHDYSVDGIHPDDHGYNLWSRSIEKPILKILKKYGIK